MKENSKTEQEQKKQLLSERKCPGISVKQYNKELVISEKQISKGKYTTQADLEMESGKW